MNPIDAFLWVTALSYCTAALIPKQFERNIPKALERALFVAMGWAIIIAIGVNHAYVWTALGTAYVVVALLSYAGYQDWGSTGHNLFMSCWDLLLAVICLSKL